jgi:hypothetical protein
MNRREFTRALGVGATVTAAARGIAMGESAGPDVPKAPAAGGTAPPPLNPAT